MDQHRHNRRTEGQADTDGSVSPSVKRPRHPCKGVPSSAYLPKPQEGYSPAIKSGTPVPSAAGMQYLPVMLQTMLTHTLVMQAKLSNAFSMCQMLQGAMFVRSTDPCMPCLLSPHARFSRPKKIGRRYVQ